MTSRSLDLTIPEHAYMFGFLQADGHLYKTTRNRGRLQVELQEADGHILTEFAKLIPCHCTLTKRTRKTNFAAEHRSVILRVYNRTFRSELESLGMISGAKSAQVSTPRVNFSKADYFRGLLDADGSLGLTGNAFPFVSLVSMSEAMTLGYVQYIKEVTGKLKSPSRNKRDGVFNIVVFKEDAQAVVSAVYYDGCLALTRKQAHANRVLGWQRPETMRKVDFDKRRWTPSEDSYIKTHTIDESSQMLSRTQQSIKMRLWRLRDK